ncbi:YkvI family membrane protein [Zophobihabitans entericus]|uniref:Membrane protein YkvI n=1 Tax=Zophobihabitans entericus TaxID=1635327 RepID=A0A6G9IA23_9GAMM|nr:hypothetical protein [Zophobihabitans entericus]QIQ20430.1 hypothetical protein IPMB12_01280 [Zophobihabitans entericus]
MNKLFLSQVYIFIASSLGYLIGGGFMSGQETIQFFVPFGHNAIGVGLVFSVVIIFVNIGFIYAGKYGGCTKGTEVFTFFCGSLVGKVIEWFSLLFCFTMFIAEIAAGGSILYEQYGLPLIIGAVITAIITAGTVSIGLNSVLKSLGIIMPFLTAFVIIVSIATLMMNGSNIDMNAVRIEEGEFELLKVAPNWFLSGISLVGLMVLFLAAFSADLATKFDFKPLVIGQSIGLVIYALLDIMASFAITSNIDQVANRQIINLFLAKEIWAPLGIAFGALIFFAIYTISTPLLHVIAIKFSDEGTKKHKLIIWGVSIVALLGAVAVPFDVIINAVYIMSGYVGSLIVILMVVKFIRIYLAKHRK